MKANTAQTFLNRIELIPFHTCWEWVGGNFNNGYGRFYQKQKTWSAHKYSYILHKGPVPNGLVVMHSCDNKNCVNPDHLSLGTPLKNTQDMCKKGRKFLTLGETNGQAKLTSEDVLRIRSSSSTSNSTLAKKYSVSPSLISMILSRKVWKHI